MPKYVSNARRNIPDVANVEISWNKSESVTYIASPPFITERVRKIASLPKRSEKTRRLPCMVYPTISIQEDGRECKTFKKLMINDKNIMKKMKFCAILQVQKGCERNE